MPPPGCSGISHSLNHLSLGLTCSCAPRIWWAVGRRKWIWRCPGRAPAGCRRQWWAASGAAAWLSLNTHISQGITSTVSADALTHKHTHTKVLEKGYEALQTAEQRHGKRCPRRSARERCKPGWNGASATAHASAQKTQTHSQCPVKGDQHGTERHIETFDRGVCYLTHTAFKPKCLRVFIFLWLTAGV